MDHQRGPVRKAESNTYIHERKWCMANHHVHRFDASGKPKRIARRNRRGKCRSERGDGTYRHSLVAITASKTKPSGDENKCFVSSSRQSLHCSNNVRDAPVHVGQIYLVGMENTHQKARFTASEAMSPWSKLIWAWTMYETSSEKETFGCQLITDCSFAVSARVYRLSVFLIKSGSIVT
jgi:hypothetical protein